jgi:hypothetical protein
MVTKLIGGEAMPGEQMVTMDLDDGLRLVVVAEQTGPVLVAEDQIEARLSSVAGSIERVGKEVLNSVKRIAPSKATVELGFGLAIEQGQLVALFGKGRAEATINVTLEWSPRTSAAPGAAEAD